VISPGFGEYGWITEWILGSGAEDDDGDAKDADNLRGRLAPHLLAIGIERRFERDARRAADAEDFDFEQAGPSPLVASEPGCSPGPSMLPMVWA
jgi:hypothetical protein